MTVVNICTPGALDPYDSFGLIALELARHLTRLGVYVNLFANGPREVETQNAEVAAIARQPIRAAMGGIFFGYPTTYDGHASPLTMLGRRIGITMFESTKIPSGWCEAMNRCQAILTPCQFCRDIFIEGGVTTPISVAPLGISSTYAYAERPIDRPFTYLAFIDRGLRKGGIQAMQAFMEAFGDDMNYRLILKGRTSPVDASIINDNIELIQRDMTQAELYDLYLSADVLINANKGEGFGIIPREMARTGGISLATNFAGTADDIDAWGLPLAYTLVNADWTKHARLGKQDLGQWAEVDQAYLVDLMREVAAKRAHYRAMAKQWAANVAEMYTWERFAQTVLDVWEGA